MAAPRPKTNGGVSASAVSSADSGVEDLVLLSPLSEKEIERNLRVRFERDLIYTNIGPVLLAVNPFRDIPGLYSEEMVDYYRSGGGSGSAASAVVEASSSLGSHNAHIFALAEDTYRTMIAEEEDQCVIISGESGAGKTEASKQIMRYVSSVSGDTPAMEHVKRIMLESNPLMEAFGNAKTLRNDNSSRFGKFLQIHFDRRGGPVGGKMTIFLLEKARVVYHQRGERNFHIFYQLCAGLGLGADGIVRRIPKNQNNNNNSSNAKQRRTVSDDSPNSASEKSGEDDDHDDAFDVIDHGALRDRLRLGPASAFHYLRMGENLTRAGVDDAAEWQQTLQAMNVVGMPESTVEQIVTTLALVLHLGQIQFAPPGDGTTTGTRGGVAGEGDDTDASDGRAPAARAAYSASSNNPCRIVNGEAVAYCADLLGVAAEQLTRALTWRRLEVGQSEIVNVPLDLQQCHQARDAVAKALYDGIFNFIVYCVNTSLESVAADVETEKPAKKTDAATATAASAPTPQPPLMLGVLDIYGFEIFDSNGFEQFCINYVNEKLQQIFIELTLCAEQEEYVREGIAWEPVQYFDNRVVVELIESVTTPVGLFAVMDDVCAAMAKEDESVVDVKMLDKLESAASGHVRRVKTLYDERHPEEAARRAELWERQERERMLNAGGKRGAKAGGGDGSAADGEEVVQADFGAAHFVRTDRGFVIKHYAGDVQYNASGFTARNKDRLSKDVTVVLARSTNAFLLNLFLEHTDVLSAEDVESARSEGRQATGTKGAAAARSQQQQQHQQQMRKRTTTAGAKIRSQAAELVQTLKRCNPHYVRTIKSNDKKQGKLFDDARVRHQVKYLGLLENVRVRRAGYSYRQYFDKFLKRFRYVCPQTYPRPYKGSDEEACQVLLRYISTHHSNGPSAFPAGAWQAGVHKLFIRQPAHLAALEQARAEAFDAIALKVQRAWRRYVNRRLFVQLKARMASVYVAHGKPRRADSVFRPYQGTYECRWWPARDDVGGEVDVQPRAAAAAVRAREAAVERLLRPLMEYDPLLSAWREVWSQPTTAAATPSPGQPSRRGGRKFYVNDLTGQVQWEPPRGWHQGLQTILFMSPVWRVTDHDVATVTQELLVLTERALYVFREVIPVASSNTGGTNDIHRTIKPGELPPPSGYELRVRVDVRLLAGLSASQFADELLIVHVFPLPAPYRPLLFHRSDASDGTTAPDAQTASHAAEEKPTTDPEDTSEHGGGRGAGAAQRHPSHHHPSRLGPPRYPVCEGCGAQLSPSLFIATESDTHNNSNTISNKDGLVFTMSPEARRRHACPGCGRWCCATRCLVHRRPLPTMTGSGRPVKVCRFCRVGEPFEPIQDLVLLTPLKTELIALLCRTYQQVMANPLSLRIGSTPAPPPNASSSAAKKSMLLYQLVTDKGDARGVLVEARTEATVALRAASHTVATPATVIDTVSPSTGERGQTTLVLKGAAYWESPTASLLLPPLVPYRDAMRARARAAKATATTNTTTTTTASAAAANGSDQGIHTASRTTTTTAPSPDTAVDDGHLVQPVTYMTLLAAPGIAPDVVKRVDAARETRRQAAAAQRRQEEDELRQREEERDRERAAAHRRLVQERKQARAAAELHDEEVRLQQEADAREREAKKARLLKEKQKEL